MSNTAPTHGDSGPIPALGDSIAEQALLLAAGIIGGMKRAAAHANIVGHHAEAYGAAEVELLSLAKKVKNGEEIRNHNGLVQRFGRETQSELVAALKDAESALDDMARGYGLNEPIEPIVKRAREAIAKARADTRCDYCRSNGFRAPNLCEDCRSPAPDMVERVADALETAELSYSMELIRLVDGESTYRLKYSDGQTLEFSSSDEVYAHVAQRKRLSQATAAIAAVLSQQVPDKRDCHDDLLTALKAVVRVADRSTDEFDLARAAIAKAEAVS
ncbi:hypothetical protein [Mesorhizobium sp.]|uniref:hypothetical protein n=1 Tax=Mesorhizobium sp. TaxID=1871066 RepID=UPI001227C7B5|nr:hypothetical protein [Mesorhizobium sp.]TIL54351.1 MAG: hypothetical protein E5Y83_02595 [Mesorhizobium sp.]